MDSAQAVVTDEETATSQTKFSGRHTFNWASSENRKRFYSQIDGDGKQLCDVKNCTKKSKSGDGACPMCHSDWDVG